MRNKSNRLDGPPVMAQRRIALRTIRACFGSKVGRRRALHARPL